MIGRLGALWRLISSPNFITSSRDNGGLGGGDLSPGLHSRRFTINEVTFLKCCVLLTAGWTKALVIFTKKKKEGKEETSRVENRRSGAKEGAKETAWGGKGKWRRRAEPQDGQGTAREESKWVMRQDKEWAEDKRLRERGGETAATCKTVHCFQCQGFC